MPVNSVTRSPCPIARSLDVVGEWWTMLILRDAFYGLSRFDEFEKSLGIAPTMLTRRLADLVAAELLDKRQYSYNPPRYEYVLTARGLDFWPVLVGLLAWGNKHFAPEGVQLSLVNRETGKRVTPELTEAHSGLKITPQDHMMGAGPAANEYLRRRVAFGAAKPNDPELRPTFLAAEHEARTAAARKSRPSKPRSRKPA